MIGHYLTPLPPPLRLHSSPVNLQRRRRKESMLLQYSLLQHDSNITERDRLGRCMGKMGA
eukprot:scaffold14275_cov221-Alexandrium_tamarense.AAC.3